MRLIAPLGISGRMLWVTLVLSLLLLGSALFTYLQLQGVTQASQRTAEVRVPQLSEIAEVELNVTRVSLQIRHAMLARTPAEREASLQDIAAKRARIDQLLASYEARLSSEEGKRRFAKVGAPLQRF